MSSPADSPSFPDALPAHLKAMLELTREANAGFWSAPYRAEHFRIMIVTILYGYIAWVDRNPTAPFLGILVIVYMLQALSDRQARRRLELLLEVLRGLQPRSKSDIAPNKTPP